MGKVENDILSLLACNPGLSDKELAEAIIGHGASVQYVNQVCKSLKTQGVICRKKREDGQNGNWLQESNFTAELVQQAGLKTLADDISEKKIKQVLQNHLTARGWELKIDWGVSDRGIDVEARRNDTCWIIQVKGSQTFRTILMNNFLLVLGEIVQRMDDPHCKYSVAFPDLEHFHRLWERLPTLAKSRTGVTALFVSLNGTVIEEK